MKTIIGMIFFGSLTAGVFNYAEAQRGRDNGGRGNRESNVSPQRGSNRSFSESRTFRQNNVSRNNSYNPGQRYERTFSPGRSDNNRVFSQRNAITRNDARVNRDVPVTRRDDAVASSSYNRDRMSSGYNRDRISSGYDRDRISSGRYNNYRYNDYRYNNYRYSNRYYGGGYYSFNNRRYSFMYGTRYTVIPRSYISIRFGGCPYYYNDGFFYGYYSGYYQPIFPPFGIHIGVLPYGYYSFNLGGYPYYYYNGIYYRQYDDYYEVVDAPMGASVYNLPQGARSVILNGEKLYELNGTYYKEDRDSNGRTIYTVVGKNGEVNNTDEGDLNNTDSYNNDNPNNDNTMNEASPSSLQIGDTISQLPEGSKVVTINGEKMYVSPDNTYLKEETDGGVVQYKVVGK
ncbi:MAG TPA: DUF6515 family protein [Ginsengibacter sp.]|nr:DUF6515 family protein [Ginsengibacter sp.]